MLQEISNRELGLAGLLEKSWSVYWQQIKAIIMIILLVYVPVSIINYIVIGYSEDFKDAQKLIGILEGFLGMITMMGIILIVENAVKNDGAEISWRAALKKAFSKWVAALGTSILAGVIIAWPMLLLVIPGFVFGQFFHKASGFMFLLLSLGVIWGIYYSLYYFFAIYAVTLRSISGKSALAYSKALVKANLWYTLAMIVAITVVNLGLNLGIEYILIFLSAEFGIIEYFLMDIFTKFILSFSTVALTVVFLNLEYERL